MKMHIAAIVSLPVLAAVAGDPLTVITGADSWGMRPRHPAVVNGVMATASPDLIRLRGEWEFVFSEGFGASRRNSHDIPYFMTTDAWKHPGRIAVPGTWGALKSGTPGMGTSWEFRYDMGPKPVRNPAIGDGWYRRRVDIPEGWAGKRVWLKIGGVASRGWFWVNGSQVAHVDGYCGAYKYDITDCVVPGKTAEIVADVSNSEPSRKGCADYVHRWGGFTRDVELEATPAVFIDEAWIRGDYDASAAEAHVGTGGDAAGCRVRVTVEGRSAEAEVVAGETVVRLPLGGFRKWSPEHPNLYTGLVELVKGGEVVHSQTERFAFRRLEVRGREFYLNGSPFFVRGFGDDSIYPVTGISPADRGYHLAHLRKARAAGFNFVRLHTHCEIPEYFEAADEAGILVQPELPYINGDIPVEHFAFDPVGDTLELQRHYRRHPSFAVYSGGNEGSFGPALDGYLYELVKRTDPDRLKICQDSQMAFINRPGISDFRGGPVTEWPRGTIDPAMPFVCHEYLNLCIKLDARTEPQFDGAWMPPTTVREREAWLGKSGLDLAWGDRLQRAQHALQRYWQKHGVETARNDPYCDGYCFWTIVDVVVRQFESYTSQGLFNPFWQEKRGGTTVAEFARFNSPVCVLADFDTPDRVFTSGEELGCRFRLSQYGEEPLRDAKLAWRLEAPGMETVSGEFDAGVQPPGPVRDLGGRVVIGMPAVDRAVKAVLTAEIGGSANSWEFWLFPKRRKPRLEGVVATPAVLPRLAKLYDGVGEYTEGTSARTLVASAGDAAVGRALAAGMGVIRIGDVKRAEPTKRTTWNFGEELPSAAVEAYDFGSDDICLGWWFMAHQVGTAMKDDRLLRHLPHEGYLSPLLFRIIGAGRRLPAEGVTKEDLVMVGEGGEACFSYITNRRTGGGSLVEIDGLDVLSGYPEGTAVLDGALDCLQGR